LMQKVIRSKTYIFEGELPEEISSLLEKWGRLVKRGEVATYSIESGEMRMRKVADGPTYSVRRIYVEPACGCLLEIDERRDFEENKVSYSIYSKTLCPQHQA
jgi:hypothetical protein